MTKDNSQKTSGAFHGQHPFADTPTEYILEEYVRDIDPELLDMGWGFISAKSVEFGKTDQPMVNHVRNGVFVLARLNEIVPAFGGRELDEKQLREAVALFVMHDLHKLRGEQASEDEYNIEKKEVKHLVEQLDLRSFAEMPTSNDDSLTLDDFHACAVDHENSERSKPGHSTQKYNRLRPFVRLADALASSDSPESAVEQRNQDALARAYPELPNISFRYHALDDVKGVFTNLLNGVVSKILRERYDHQLLAIYQDGCVYLTTDEEDVVLNEMFVETLYEQLKDDINESHDAYQDKVKLAENLTTRSQGFYGINEQDFFYAGTGKVLSAIVTKATQDADPEADPTDSMRETMEELSEFVPFDIDSENRVAAGYARLAYTVKRAFVDPVVAESELSDNSLSATCNVFDLPQEATDALVSVREESNLNLTAGGKWDYGYAIGQHVANHVRSEPLQPGEVARWVINGLTALDEKWPGIVMDAHTGELADELRTYIADVVRIEGGSLPPTEMEPSDAFEEHHAKRRGKTCTFCNRGATSTRKSDMEAPKSLTTFQAGYSNRIPADSGKPDNLLVCVPCQVEFSLRETGSQWRADDRLFVHLVPDYFYTPQMWNLYADEIFHRFSGEEMTRIGWIASAIFKLASDDRGRFERIDEYVPVDDDPERAESFAQTLREATTTEGGRRMVEQLSQGFDPEAGFSAQTLSFHKPQDNETEFQFFGVFIGLAVASSMGLRAYVSQSPIPDVRGRDFQQMAKLGAGFSRITDFYGSDIPLSALRERLGAAAALIQLGYERKQEDSLFAKYLRVTRNELLPGAYLLKRAVQASNDGDNAKFLLEEAEFLDTYSGKVITDRHRHGSKVMKNDTSERISTLADYAFDAIRPVGGNSKPYAIERVFRESVKAVKESNSLEIDRQDAIDRITGRLQKLPDRSDQVYRVSEEKSKRGGTPNERIEAYADLFVTKLLEPKYEMKPSLLKRDANNLADGFYAATLRLQRELWNDDNEE
jgi:CRISPR-associated protein Csc3